MANFSITSEEAFMGKYTFSLISEFVMLFPNHYLSQFTVRIKRYFILKRQILNMSLIYTAGKTENTGSNKKTHLADFETCVFRIYLRNHLSFQMKK